MRRFRGGKVLGCRNTTMTNEKETMEKDARWISRRELADKSFN